MPNFNALVRGMSKEQLGIFCRVLAMVVFEPDDRNSDEIGMHIAVSKKGTYIFCSIFSGVTAISKARTLCYSCCQEH